MSTETIATLLSEATIMASEEGESAWKRLETVMNVKGVSASPTPVTIVATKSVGSLPVLNRSIMVFKPLQRFREGDIYVLRLIISDEHGGALIRSHGR